MYAKMEYVKTDIFVQNNTQDPYPQILLYNMRNGRIPAVVLIITNVTMTKRKLHTSTRTNDNLNTRIRILASVTRTFVNHNM